MLSVSLSGNSPHSANETLVAKPVTERPPSNPCASSLRLAVPPVDIKFVSSTGQATSERLHRATRAPRILPPPCIACRPTITGFLTHSCPITAQFAHAIESGEPMPMNGPMRAPIARPSPAGVSGLRPAVVP